MLEAVSSNPYGRIYQSGISTDGRMLYDVIDSEGKNAGKLSVSLEDTDTFEKAYNNILTSASKIQKYTLENSSEADKNQRKWLSRGIITGCGIIGTATAIYLTKNVPSATKKILALVTGIVSGLSVGFIGSLAATSPPETFNFIKASRAIAKLDIKKID